MTKNKTSPPEAAVKIKDFSACDAVRQNAAYVAKSARHLRINEEKLDAYADMLLSRYALVTEMDADVHFVDKDDPDTTIAYFMVLDSINFGSGYFDLARAAGVDFEYAPIATRLKEAFIDGRLRQPAEWAAATPDQFHDILQVGRGLHPSLDRLMGLFAHHLRLSGERIIKDGYGTAAGLVRAAGGAAALVNIVSRWAGFADVAHYNNRKLAVFKRAQILAADIHLALSTPEKPFFADIGQVTIFADNMVPHVLKYDGILEYAPALSATIERGEMILAGSEEETEMRLVSIHAVELIKQKAHVQGYHAIISMNLDHLLWHRGYEPAVYAAPRHKTLSVWY